MHLHSMVLVLKVYRLFVRSLHILLMLGEHMLWCIGILCLLVLCLELYRWILLLYRSLLGRWGFELVMINFQVYLLIILLHRCLYLLVHHLFHYKVFLLLLSLVIDLVFHLLLFYCLDSGVLGICFQVLLDYLGFLLSIDYIR